MLPKTTWHPIKASPFLENPERKEKMLPVWSFRIRYDGPDGEIDIPDSYMGDDGVVEWEIAHKSKSKGLSKEVAARKYYYYDARHIDKRFSINYRCEKEDEVRPVSDTCGDMAKDREVVFSFRDKILSREGLSKDSAPHELVQAFAYELYKNWRGGGARNHPADVLTHKSWCLGASTATGVLLRSLGVMVRGTRTSDHAMCEALLDNKWHLIDSSNHFINHEPKSVPFLPTDFMRLSTDPLSDLHGEEISDYHKGFFYHFPAAHYGIADGRWLEQSLLFLCPQYAHALYPDHPQTRFKTLEPGWLEVLTRNFKMLYRYDLGHNLLAGETLCEEIYLSDLEDAKECIFELRFMHIDGRFPTDAMLSDLVFHINDEEVPVLKLKQGDYREHHDRTVLLDLNIPKDRLKENSVNMFALENKGPGRFCRIPLTMGIVEPYVEPLALNE
ncbi:MAG: hypothetical protein ACYTFY_12495 [Planctomycetota bacterium]|jgi:hypothetical protein